MTDKFLIILFLAFFVDAQIWNDKKIIQPGEESNFNKLAGLGTLIASKIDLPSKNLPQNSNNGQQSNSNFKKPDVISRPSKPYWIQQKTVTNTGEIIIEKLVGGIKFDCSSRPTGHWRDSIYCDIFHACVFGHQRKTYSCPFVGEYTYFDEFTHRCEFLRANPSGCSTRVFFH